jgi:hypothetical protein
MEVNAWSSGDSGYGIAFGNELRDKLFDKAWEHVDLYLGASKESIRVGIAKSFWVKCPAVRSKTIKHWFEENGFAPWPSGSPLTSS